MKNTVPVDVLEEQRARCQWNFVPAEQKFSMKNLACGTIFSENSAAALNILFLVLNFA